MKSKERTRRHIACIQVTRWRRADGQATFNRPGRKTLARLVDKQTGETPLSPGASSFSWICNKIAHSHSFHLKRSIYLLFLLVKAVSRPAEFSRPRILAPETRACARHDTYWHFRSDLFAPSNSRPYALFNTLSFLRPAPCVNKRYPEHSRRSL